MMSVHIICHIINCSYKLSSCPLLHYHIDNYMGTVQRIHWHSHSNDALFNYKVFCRLGNMWEGQLTKHLTCSNYIQHNAECPNIMIFQWKTWVLTWPRFSRFGRSSLINNKWHLLYCTVLYGQSAWMNSDQWIFRWCQGCSSAEELRKISNEILSSPDPLKAHTFSAPSSPN